MIRKVQEMGPNLVPDRWHSAAWVAHIERMASRTRPLPSRPTGGIRPDDPMESLDLALICSDQKRFVASARYWGWAIEADPTLGDDRRFQYWFSAACTAAMAAVGKRPGRGAARRSVQRPMTAPGSPVAQGRPEDLDPYAGIRLAPGPRPRNPGDATMAEGHRPDHRPRCGGHRHVSPRLSGVTGWPSGPRSMP